MENNNLTATLYPFGLNKEEYATLNEKINHEKYFKNPETGEEYKAEEVGGIKVWSEVRS